MTNECLAINGGTPVRIKPYPEPYLGTSVYGKEELALLREVVENKLPFRAYGDGNPHMVDDFEEEAKEYFNMPYALATATGSGSYYCAMAGLGIGPGDEVIIPSFCWFTDFLAPALLGAVPVFADIDQSLNLDPEDFERKITERTKAVIVVYFQGAAADIDRILEIAAKHNIKVIEDCAQALGADYKGRKVGSFGDVSCFSMQQNKIISTGDGGLMLAKDPVVYERAVRFHDLGMMRPKFLEKIGGRGAVNSFIGCQFRMNEFTGAVALAQFRKLDSHILDITRKYFKRLKNNLPKSCSGIKFRESGDPEGDAGIAFYMNLETKERAGKFEKALKAEGIPVGPTSGCRNILESDVVKNKQMIHPDMPPFGPGFAGENVEYRTEQCPNTNIFAESMVCVPLVPSFSEQDVADIEKAIVKVWNGLNL